MKNKSNAFKALVAINAVVIGGAVLVLVTDASLRALVAEYAIPSGIALVVFVLLAMTAREKDSKDTDVGVDMLSPIHNMNHIGFTDENDE